MSPGEVEGEEMEEEVEEEFAPARTAQQQLTWGQFSCETRSQSASSLVEQVNNNQPTRWSGLTDEEPINKHTNGTEEPPQLRVAVPGQPRDQGSRTTTLLRTLAC